MQDGAVVARKAHNLEVAVSSNPAPATKQDLTYHALS